MNSNLILFTDILPTKTKSAFLALADSSLLTKSKWYLAGGTALALQAGHRQSVDLDFFLPAKKFNIPDWETRLIDLGKWETTQRSPGTLYGTFRGAKVSFIVYPFFQPSKLLTYGNLRIVHPSDIAAMKIVAISQRGRKRDFVDLYWYCVNHESLEKVIQRTIKQYPFKDHNITHFLNSLIYFDDAEADPMPILLFDVTWKEIKKFFRKEVPIIARKLLRLDR